MIGLEIDLRVMAYPDKTKTPVPYLSTGGLRVLPVEVNSMTFRNRCSLALSALLANTALKVADETQPIIPIGETVTIYQIEQISKMIKSGNLRHSRVRMSSLPDGSRIIQFDLEPTQRT